MIDFADISQSKHPYKEEQNDLNNLYLIEWGANLNCDINVFALLIKSSVVTLILISLLHSPTILPRWTSLDFFRYQKLHKYFQW